MIERRGQTDRFHFCEAFLSFHLGEVQTILSLILKKIISIVLPKVHIQWQMFFKCGGNASASTAMAYSGIRVPIWKLIIGVSKSCWQHVMEWPWCLCRGRLPACRNKCWQVIHESSQTDSHFLPLFPSDYCGGGSEVLHECSLPLSGLLSLSAVMTLCLIGTPVSVSAGAPLSRRPPCRQQEATPAHANND